MLSLETAVDPNDLERFDWSVRNLRDQVRELESALLLQRATLEESRRQLEVFETAAAERLRVIEEADELLRTRAGTIAALEAEMVRLQEAASAATAQIAEMERKHAAEVVRLERARREDRRGMDELAARERTLTAEILELRHEGLVHSIIRRLRDLLK